MRKYQIYLLFVLFSFAAKAQYIGLDKHSVEESVSYLNTSQSNFVITYQLTNNYCNKYVLQFKDTTLYSEFKKALIVGSKKINQKTYIHKNVRITFIESESKIIYTKV